MYWFDTTEGKLIVGDAAYESVIEQTGPGDVVPLIDLLDADDFDIDYSTYDRYPRKLHRSEEECVTYGKWVLQLIESSENPRELSREDFERLSRLGLGMAWTAITKTLGNYWEIIEQIGANNFSSPGTYDHWTKDDFIENASRLAATLDRKPTKADYIEWARQGHGPGPRVIWEKCELDLRELNESIGYPNIHDWAVDDYLAWGARVMDANDGQPLSQSVIDILSKRKSGPSYSNVRSVFGSFSRFVVMVEERYQQVQQQRREVVVDEALVEKGDQLTKRLGKYAPRIDKTKAEFAARLELTRAALPSLSEAEKMHIAYTSRDGGLISLILDENMHLSESDVVGLAKELNLYETIWPTNSAQARLRVTKRELNNARRVNTANKRKQRAKHV